MTLNIPRLSEQTEDQLLHSYVLAPRSNWSVLKASGPTVRDYLQGQITQDMGKLDAGQAIHSCVLSPQGKAVSELFIIEGNSDNELVLLTPASHAVATVNRLRKFAMGHELRLGIVDSMAVCAAQGANATQLLSAFDLSEPGDSWLASSRNNQTDSVALVMPNIPRGFWVVSSKAQIDKVIQASENIVPEHELEAMRIIRGMPDFGVEWNESTFPMNANLIEFDGVSFDKGCYVGQEVTSRMQWRGGIRKKLYRVSIGGVPDTLPCPVKSTVKIGELHSAAIDHENSCFGIAHLPIETAESNTPLCLENGAEITILEPCHA
jgi:folate-binding protein YgfZ